eukprot:m51a1_g6623 hypothetical protein (870) ;mRNA; r:48703-51820
MTEEVWLAAEDRSEEHQHRAERASLFAQLQTAVRALLSVWDESQVFGDSSREVLEIVSVLERILLHGLRDPRSICALIEAAEPGTTIPLPAEAPAVRARAWIKAALARGTLAGVLEALAEPGQHREAYEGWALCASRVELQTAAQTLVGLAPVAFSFKTPYARLEALQEPKGAKRKKAAKRKLATIEGEAPHETAAAAPEAHAQSRASFRSSSECSSAVSSPPPPTQPLSGAPSASPDAAELQASSAPLESPELPEVATVVAQDIPAQASAEEVVQGDPENKETPEATPVEEATAASPVPVAAAEAARPAHPEEPVIPEKPTSVAPAPLPSASLETAVSKASAQKTAAAVDKPLEPTQPLGVAPASVATAKIAPSVTPVARAEESIPVVPPPVTIDPTAQPGLDALRSYEESLRARFEGLKARALAKGFVDKTYLKSVNSPPPTVSLPEQSRPAPPAPSSHPASSSPPEGIVVVPAVWAPAALRVESEELDKPQDAAESEPDPEPEPKPVEPVSPVTVEDMDVGLDSAFPYDVKAAGSDSAPDSDNDKYDDGVDYSFRGFLESRSSKKVDSRMSVLGSVLIEDYVKDPEPLTRSEIKLRTSLRESSDGKHQAASTTPSVTDNSLRLQKVVLFNPPEKPKTKEKTCYGCGAPIGSGLFASGRLCAYTGRYFCARCHSGKKFYVPARIFHAWDFNQYPINNRSLELLETIFSEPAFDLWAINPKIFKKATPLRDMRALRFKLFHMRNFILTCTRLSSEDPAMKALNQTPSFYVEYPTMYSLEILVKAEETMQTLGQLLVKWFDHISFCTICKAKGSICELCNDRQPIYPFQITEAVSCAKCKGVFHRKCFDPNKCPRCARLNRRSVVVSQM